MDGRRGRAAGWQRLARAIEVEQGPVGGPSFQELGAPVFEASRDGLEAFGAEPADPELEDLLIAEELVRGADPLDLPADEEREAIAVLDEVRGNVRGEDRGRAALARGAKEVCEDSEAWRVQPRGRFIEEDDLRVRQEGLGQAEAAVHSAGERSNRSLASIVEADPVQHFMDAAAALRAVEAVERRDQIEDSTGGQLGREGRSVRKEGEAPTNGPGRGGGSEDFNPSGARAVHPGEQAQERGLPGAVWPDDAHGLAALDVEADVTQRQPAPPAEAATEGPAEAEGLDSGRGRIQMGRRTVGGHGFLPETRAIGATIRAMARLFVLSGASIGATHDIEGTTVLGRGADADVMIPEPSVSRRHARLIPEQEPGVWKLRDLKSSNGVHVGGQRVEEAQVRDGETFTLGEVEFRLRDEAGAAAEAEPALELEFEDEIELPGLTERASTGSAPRGPGATGPKVTGSAGAGPDPGAGETADNERLRAARARAAEDRAARRAAALEGPAGSPAGRPAGDRSRGAGQVLQYAQHQRGDDLAQLSGWRRLLLGILAVAIAAGVAYGAFELTRTAREQAAEIGD